MNVMADKFQAILDVTIVYPDGAPDFWQFLCGRMKRVRVRVQTLPVPTELARADYARDPAVREAFQQWLQQIWQDKDRQITDCCSRRADDDREPAAGMRPDRSQQASPSAGRRRLRRRSELLPCLKRAASCR
jgi:hypothetical protein